MRSRAQVERDAMSASKARVEAMTAESVDRHQWKLRQDLRTLEQAQANAGPAQRELRGKAGRSQC